MKDETIHTSLGCKKGVLILDGASRYFSQSEVSLYQVPSKKGTPMLMGASFLSCNWLTEGRSSFCSNYSNKHETYS